jgi:hypothetical protein
MAFNNVGNWFLKYGESAGFSISFGGQDMGAQYIAGDPLAGQSQLVVSGNSKLRDEQGNVTYLCAILNNGPIGTGGNPGVGTQLSLQGGGFV